MKYNKVEISPIVPFILFIIGITVACIFGITNVNAAEVSSFDFMNVNYNSFWIEPNNSKSGTLSITVEDITKIKPYINIIIAGTSDPQFNVTTNSIFTDSWVRKLHSYGTATVAGYTANTYIIQFSTKGLSNWNCSVQGTNCYASTTINMYHTVNYSSVFQIKSISLTDSILNDDYLSNITINQNNEIIDQNETIINQNQSIIDGQDKIEQSIIDSNKETQDVIKDQFNSCRDSVNLIPMSIFDTMNINKTGNTYNGNTHTITFTEDASDYSGRYKLLSSYLISGNTYTLSFDVRGTEGRRARIGWSNFSTITLTETYKRYSFTLTYDGSSSAMILYSLAADNNGLLDGDYIQFDNVQLELGSTATPYEEYGEKICTNKLDDTNDKLNGIQGALTDSSEPNTSALENSAGWLPAGPLDSVLNLPLSLFNALTTNLNKSCNPINIPLPYVNKNITLPCINTLYNQIGITSFLSWIGVIVSGLMLYTYLLKLYKWIEDRISLNETHNVDSWGGL